jgi:methionyl-tRNA formyltransferase
MGTPEFVVPIFDKIADQHEIAAVFTRAPKPAGRKRELTRSPVHEWAESKGVPVYTKISECRARDSIDCVVVIAYGVIIPDDLLAQFRFINIHPSDLPKYRGPSPIATAIYNGDAESAVCLMQVAHAVDAGAVMMRRKFVINENETAADIENKVSAIAPDMILEYLDAPDKFPSTPQAGEPTFTRKFTGDDEIIDWTRSAPEIHNQIRAIGGRTKINGIDAKILETQVANNELKIIKLQPAGKKPMDWKSFTNGLHSDNSPSLGEGVGITPKRSVGG